MKTIERGACPSSLAPSSQAGNGGGTRSADWRRADVVAQLREDAAGKCMYCEAQVGVTGYGAVEHIAPKSVFPERASEWENLGFCCQRCNTNKGAYWSEEEALRLLDPYTDSVEEHIDWAGPIPIVKNGSTRAENTLRKLKFETRDDLIISRSRRIQELENRIRAWERESRPDYKEVLAEDIHMSVRAEVEFHAALKSFAELRGFPSDT